MKRFIVFEGPEGSGKSTQLPLLADALTRAGQAIAATREPGGTPLGDALRALLLDVEATPSAAAEAYLMTAARAEHVRLVIRPALEAGKVVLCDRFVDSTLAYQGAGRGLPLDELRAMQTLAVDDVWPDLIVLLDVPVEVGLARRAAAGDRNRMDRESLAFHERVAAWYRAEARRCPERWRTVDGTRDPAMVHTAILDAVSTTFAAVVPGRTNDGGSGAA